MRNNNLVMEMVRLYKARLSVCVYVCRYSDRYTSMTRSFRNY